ELVLSRRRLAQDFRHAPGRHPAVDVHLPQAVLGRHIALREKHVFRIGGLDVGYAPLVPVDAHFAAEAGQMHGAVPLGQRAGQIPIPAADDNARADDQQNQHAQEHDPKSAPPASGPEDGYCTPSHHESPFSRGTADRKWLLALVRWEAGFTCVMAGARTPERVTHRNGYRERAWETRVGTINLRIPKLRQGSYFPSLLEPRRRAEKALVAVIQEAYILGVSTRKVDELSRPERNAPRPSEQSSPKTPV